MFKKSLTLLLVVLLVVSLTTLVYAAAPTDVRLTWSGNTATTQTISWTTDTATKIGKIQFKNISGGTYTTINALAPETYQEVNLWSSTLKNLAPKTTYSYRVGDGTNWSPYYTFTTAAGSPAKFKFMVMGDTSNEDLEYSGAPNMWGDNLKAAITRNPDAKFLVDTGDIVDKGQFYKEWAAWLKAAGTVPSKIPFMLTIAKDECNWGGDYAPVPSETSPPVLFPKMWVYPQNGPDKYKGQAYSFDYNNVHITSIPIQLNDYYPEVKDQDAMLAEIVKWVEADLSATKQPWKVVIMHLNFYTTMSDRSAVKYRNVLQPIFDKYKVDVVFDGHVHTIARTFPMKNNVMYDNPSKGTVYYTVGAAQMAAKGDVDKKIWHAFTYDQQTRVNYFTVEVDGSKLNIKTFLDDGKLIDDYKINKANPKLSTQSLLPAPYEDTHIVSFGTVSAWWNTYLAEGYGEFPFKDNNPKKKIPDLIPNGEWCFDIKTLAVLINGVWDPAKCMIIYDDLGVELKVPADTVSKDGNYISEVGLRAAGFDVRYDEAMNLWYIERYRP